jgi:hypothetical protein
MTEPEGRAVQTHDFEDSTLGGDRLAVGIRHGGRVLDEERVDVLSFFSDSFSASFTSSSSFPVASGF